MNSRVAAVTIGAETARSIRFIGIGLKIGLAQQKGRDEQIQAQRTDHRHYHCGIREGMETRCQQETPARGELKVAAVPAADPDALILPIMDEVANQYSGPKDGNQHFDPRKHPQLMRK